MHVVRCCLRAAIKGHKDIMEMFIKEDSSVIQLDSNGDNALSAAIAKGSRNGEISSHQIHLAVETGNKSTIFPRY